VAQGVAEFDLWLRDLLRQGLLQLPERPPAFAFEHFLGMPAFCRLVFQKIHVTLLC
jgi:hypothetical protein